MFHFTDRKRWGLSRKWSEGRRHGLVCALPPIGPSPTTPGPSLASVDISHHVSHSLGHVSMSL